MAKRDDLLEQARAIVARRAPAIAGADADDVGQDVLLKLMERLDLGEAPDNLEAYLVTALKNRVIDVAKAHDRAKRQQTGANRGDEGSDPSRDLEDKGLMGRLFIPPTNQFASVLPVWQDLRDRILDLLEPLERELLTRRFQDGESSKSLAQQFGMTPNAVDKSLHGIRAKLRNLARNAPTKELFDELRKPHPKKY